MAKTEYSSGKTLPEFCEGIQYFGAADEALGRYGSKPAIEGFAGSARGPLSDDFVYQTLLGADAMRYLVMQMTATKASGHPGGFASSAEAVSALMMLGHKNMITEVGHHAPGYYAAMFLDGSLETIGIRSVGALISRFREQGGLLGHITGAIPGVLAPAGPLGQGEHFALAAAYLNRDILFPLTIGDGGFGEPYVMSAFKHFRTLFPSVTNYLPILIWNGFSQEHHSIVSQMTNEEMTVFWEAHGFRRVCVVDAHDFGASGSSSAYSDTTTFSLQRRMGFTRSLLETIADAAEAALGGEATVVVVKQLKGAGTHVTGARSHNLNPVHTLENNEIRATLERLALPPHAWELVRENFCNAGGGPASTVAVTEWERPLPELGALPLQEFAKDEKVVPTTAFGELVGTVGKVDPGFVVTNADGNQASGMMNINQALGIRHPQLDELYAQRPDGRVYEPLSEDACAGLSAAISLMGGRSLWCSYESFAVNGLPVWQTVTQAMTELRRPTPSAIALFTAGALEQGRNGWTHQRPEVEGYIASMMRNGNIFPLFPIDANMIQAAYRWSLEKKNLGIPIFASKSALPIRSSMAEAAEAIKRGAMIVRDGIRPPDLTIATVGDMVLAPVMEAVERLESRSVATRVVAVVSPRRLYRSGDVSWDRAAQPDDGFMSDEQFSEFFAGRAVLGVTGGASGMLEPVALRVKGVYDTLCWKRGDTTASAAALFELNGMSAGRIVERAMSLLSRVG